MSENDDEGTTRASRPSAARSRSLAGIGCSGRSRRRSVQARRAARTESIARCSRSRSPTIRTTTELDARDAKAPPRFEVKAPQGAPNVIVFLIDDIGFGHAEHVRRPAFPMPTLDRLASQGLKYNRFHTTALCSPTRVALLTGRNHHTNNAGAIMEVATAFPGNTGARPQSVTPLAEILRQNGYSTAAFGKYHETAPWEVSVSGPFDRWPTHSGFDKFYGFIGGETNQWAPLVFDGTVKVEPPHDPNYHFTTDMTNQAIQWIRSQQSLTPDKPFFTYFATGATHAPHHVPKDWIAKFKGKFDGGWDKYREETFARQKQMGIIPQNAKLAAKPADIKDWDKLTRRREAAVRAADGGVRGVRRAHRPRDRPRGEGDRGPGRARQHADPVRGRRQRRQRRRRHGRHVQRDDVLQRRRRRRCPTCSRTSTSGAGPRPSRTWRRAGRWPATRPSCGPSRSPPTSAARATRSSSAGPLGSRPRARSAASSSTWSTSRRPCSKRRACRSRRRSTASSQTPMEGVSMVYTFDDAKAAGRHKTQYFEIFGNRAIYSDGWVAATVHKAPWEAEPRHKLAEDVWELYNVDEDFSETNDLAASNPAKLKELQALFMKEAERYRVLPIDDRVARTVRPRHGGPSGPDGRPQVAHGLRGHDGHDGERLHQREEPVGDDHGRRGDSRRRRQRRDPLPGRPLRRLEPLRQGRQAGLHVQLRGPPGVHGQRAASGSRRARRRSSSTSPTTATAAARAERPRSSSTTRRSDRDASSTPTPTSSPPTTPPTWAWTKGPT